jgi:hypothetical protein
MQSGVRCLLLKPCKTPVLPATENGAGNFASHRVYKNRFVEKARAFCSPLTGVQQASGAWRHYSTGGIVACEPYLPTVSCLMKMKQVELSLAWLLLHHTLKINCDNFSSRIFDFVLFNDNVFLFGEGTGNLFRLWRMLALNNVPSTQFSEATGYANRGVHQEDNRRCCPEMALFFFFFVVRLSK